jgi:hypothetical protein
LGLGTAWALLYRKLKETYLLLICRLLILLGILAPLLSEANNFYTNGYRVRVFSVEGTTCRRVYDHSYVPPLLSKVFKSWHGRRDYKHESLLRLQDFELSLPEDRTKWLSIEKDTDSSVDDRATIRFFDGRKTSNDAKEADYLLPMERKFPNLEIRNVLGNKLLELGLLDVTIGTDGGMDSLFHHFSKLIMNYENLDKTHILATARPANARLYQSQLGFTEVIGHDGKPMKTADGMSVLSMNSMAFIAKFFGKRIYPVRRGDTDQWQEYYQEQTLRIKKTMDFASHVAASIDIWQGNGMMSAGVRVLNSNVSASRLRQQWTGLLEKAKSALANEDFENFTALVDQVWNQAYDFEPVVTHYTHIPQTMRIGYTRITRTINIPHFVHRNRARDLVESENGFVEARPVNPNELFNDLIIKLSF